MRPQQYSQQDNYDIYAKPLREDRPLRLTSDPAQEFDPARSPDGRTIAFLRLKPANIVKVIAIPASGGPARVLTQFFYDSHTFVKFRTRFLSWRPGSRRSRRAGSCDCRRAVSARSVRALGSEPFASRALIGAIVVVSLRLAPIPPANWRSATMTIKALRAPPVQC
jgi:hypothetical protein